MSLFKVYNNLLNNFYETLVSQGLSSEEAQIIVADVASKSISEFDSMNITQLENVLLNCRSCYGKNLVTEHGPVPGYGNRSNVDILFVGLMPGEVEEVDGKPFRGPNAEVFRDACKKNNIGTSSCPVYMINLVNCMPVEKSAPKMEQIYNCEGYWFRAVDVLQPNIIVPLGTKALGSMVGYNAKLEDYEEQPFVFGGKMVVPMKHPSAIHRILDTPTRNQAKLDYYKAFAGLAEMNQKINELKRKSTNVTDGTKEQLPLE